ncbi:MAG: hypothetical protein GXY50_08690 [Syntrophomonadaceae bacterium]|nr:hypothetical protein [Syntrophomonadaceae bacterium]
MKLVIDDQVWELENSKTGIEEMIKLLEEKSISAADQFFSHLLIDDIAVYDDFAGYLQENISNVSQIRAEFLTVSEYTHELLISAKDYLNRAIPAIDQLADSFYNQVDSGSWLQVNHLLEGIQWLLETFETIDSLPNLAGLIDDYRLWNIYSQSLRELQESVTQLDDPLKFADFVTVGDMLLYEIKPALEKMMTNVPSVK